MDKIMFWKHKPEPRMSMDTPSDLGLGHDRDLGLGLDEPQDFGASLTPPGMQNPIGQVPGVHSQSQQNQMQSFQQQMPQPSIEKDIQLLNAKMDSLKALLDNIHQRLANIERIAHESQGHDEYAY